MLYESEKSIRINAPVLVSELASEGASGRLLCQIRARPRRASFGASWAGGYNIILTATIFGAVAIFVRCRRNGNPVKEA